MATNPFFPRHENPPRFDAEAAPVKGPCGHDVMLFTTVDGRRVPIMLGPWPLRGGEPQLWCQEGWVQLTHQEFHAINDAFGGHA